MANFNLDDEVLDIFWDQFGIDAELDIGSGFNAIRVIDMTTISSMLIFDAIPGLNLSARNMMSVNNAHTVLLIRPADMIGLEQGAVIKKLGKTYYVINPEVNIVGIGEVIVSLQNN